MMNPTVSLWIVTIAGWLVIGAVGLFALIVLLDRLLTFLGVIRWMLATIAEVRKGHGWVDECAPWWVKRVTNTSINPFK